MKLPCCIIRIDSEVLEDGTIIPKLTMFPRPKIEKINKILNDAIDLSLEDIIKIVESGNTKIIGDYLVYKGKTGYYWKRVKEKIEIPEPIAYNYIKLPKT